MTIASSGDVLFEAPTMAPADGFGVPDGARFRVRSSPPVDPGVIYWTQDCVTVSEAGGDVLEPILNLRGDPIRTALRTSRLET